MTDPAASFDHAPPTHDSDFVVHDRRPVLALFLSAFLLRLAVFLTASHVYHIPLSAYAAKGDGASYLACAKALLGDRSDLTDYDRRVFPGYPALIALFHLTGLSLPLSALLIDWLSAAVAAAVAYALFPDRRVAWAMLFLLPHYLPNSSLAMSEAPLLAFTLAGLLLTQRNRPLAGGILLGLAGLIRPMACFAVAGALIAAATQRQWRRALIIALSATAVVAAGLLIVHLGTGDALANVRVYRDSPRAYGGALFRPPFYSLLTIPRLEHVSLGFVTYIYAHVLIVLAACAALAHRTFPLKPRAQAAGDAPGPSSSRPASHALNVLTLTWLLSNTLFQLCIGSTWGFRHFPRFAIPAQPALFWALHPYVPRRSWPWCLAAVGIFYLAVVCVNLAP